MSRSNSAFLLLETLGGAALERGAEAGRAPGASSKLVAVERDAVVEAGRAAGAASVGDEPSSKSSVAGSGSGPSIAHFRDSYLDLMKASILL